MKVITLIITLCLFSANVLAQHFQYFTQDRHAVIDDRYPAFFLLDSLSQPVESFPQYAAGVDELYKLIYKYVNYPEEAFQRRLGAKVEARFLIDKKGKATLKDISPEPSVMYRVRVEMAIRNMGRWIPARIQGQPADMQCRITVLYEVQQGEVESVNGFGDLDGLAQQLRSAELSSLRPTIHFFLPFSYLPYWKEGDASLQTLVDAELPYPAKALAKGEQGEVRCRVTVEKTGEVSDIDVQGPVKTSHLVKAVKSFLKKHSASWHSGASYGIESPAIAQVSFTFDIDTQKVTVKVL